MLGVVGLLVVAYIGKKLLAREAPAPVDTRMTVPMALADLEPGTRVTEAHLANGPSDRSKITRDIILTSRALVGRVVKNKITAAQPINTKDLYPPGQNAPLDIDPNMVAVSVNAPAPFVAERGQYVNVHFTPESDPDQERTGGQVMTLFQGVKVLAISVSSRGGGSDSGVTLELTKEQANILLLARDKGALNFTLAPGGKGSGGVAVSDEDRATLYEILGYKPTPETPPTPPVTTDIFKGGGHGVNAFRNGRHIDDFNDDAASRGNGGVQGVRGVPHRGGGGTGGGGSVERSPGGSGNQSSGPSAQKPPKQLTI